MVTVNNTAIYLEVAKRVVKKEMIIMWGDRAINTIAFYNIKVY